MAGPPTGSRFTVIEGGSSPAPERPSAKGAIERYSCSKCSEAFGYPFDTLIQAMLGAHEQDGEIIAGQTHWVCGSCLDPKFLCELQYEKCKR